MLMGLKTCATTSNLVKKGAQQQANLLDSMSTFPDSALSRELIKCKFIIQFPIILAPREMISKVSPYERKDVIMNEDFFYYYS